MVELCKQRLEVEVCSEEADKAYWTQALQLISFNSLIAQHMTVSLKETCKDLPVALIRTYKELCVIASVDFFANYLKGKLECGKPFKAKALEPTIEPAAFG